ncbi:MAG: hypothetical protein QOE45_2883 [Frankiaceae bacterium]|jgi:hypothetical protein|nr:hypothetical protein [Frankiaceae bacterium]
MRTLSLRREALSELTPDDLTAVVGGQAITASPGITCPIRICLSDDFTCLQCITGAQCA